jgi:type III pantothenate kinase
MTSVSRGMVVLAIDVGNSRIKWGLNDGSRWIDAGAVDHAQRAALQSAWSNLPAGCEAIGSNVSTPHSARSIDALLGVKGIRIRWIESRPVQCGVRNLYTDAAQLGTDRWAALIGTRATHPGACLVVSAGTAVTVDALTAAGDFLGGLILPGLWLMPDALARDTARLARDTGVYADFPRTTADAIASGAIDAVVGAVERFGRRLRVQVGGTVGLVATGGAIGVLKPHLAPDVRVVENLVLEGLLIIAAAS